jgi:abortive infection bacteriophage resistance protein
MSESTNHFLKPSLSLDEQIALLENRGLIIENPQRLHRYLRFIGYYRLSGYFRYFQIKDDPLNRFQPNTTFDQTLRCYIFDRKLRLMIMDAVERIEVAFRTIVSNWMSQKFGAHWYLDKCRFLPNFDHEDFIKKIQKETGYLNQNRRNEFCSHYFKTYSHPNLPPSWMVAELLSIGTWSSVYNHLPYSEKKPISDTFEIPSGVLASWMHAITYLRNLCAHHMRIWNRLFTVKPAFAKKFQTQMRDNHRFYAYAVILNVLLRIIADGSKWHQRLYDLLQDYDDLPKNEMGFPENWQQDPFWRIGTHNGNNKTK